MNTPVSQYLPWLLWTLVLLTVVFAVITNPRLVLRIRGRSLIIKGKLMVALGTLLMGTAQSMQRAAEDPAEASERQPVPVGFRIVRRIVRSATKGAVLCLLFRAFLTEKGEHPSFALPWLVLSCGAWVSSLRGTANGFRAKLVDIGASLGSFLLVCGIWHPPTPAARLETYATLLLVWIAIVPLIVFAEIGVEKWWARRKSRRTKLDSMPPAA